jgi:hypothetical protein
MQRFAATEIHHFLLGKKGEQWSRKNVWKNKMLVNTIHVLLYSKNFKGQSQLFKIPIYLGMLDRDPKSRAMIPKLIFLDQDYESHSAFLILLNRVREIISDWSATLMPGSGTSNPKDYGSESATLQESIKKVLPGPLAWH